MSVRERPKKSEEEEVEQSTSKTEKKQPKQSMDDWLDSMTNTKPTNTQVTKPVSKPATQQKEPEAIAVDKMELLLREFTKNLPGWIQKPWMYVKPTHEGHLESWYQSWKDLILSYSSILAEHIINLYELQKTHPFSNSGNNRKLELTELQFIVEKMVDENIAKWMDDESLQARIYYKSDEEWAEIIYRFSIDEGYAAEVMTLFELKKLEQEWTTLPESELSIVLDVLVDSGRARWIGATRDSIEFIY